MRTIAFDIGDKWTGVALSDPSGIVARPYTTIKTTDLHTFVDEVISKEQIASAVVGVPITLRGTLSDQTKKIIAIKEELETTFSMIEWALWDERFTSRQAAAIKKTKNKSDKLQSHAIAAALILSGYLEFKRFHSSES